jgi:hypothetical protein
MKKQILHIGVLLVGLFVIAIATPNISFAQTAPPLGVGCGGGAACTSNQVCVTVDGATRCLNNQATSGGICPGDSSIRCGSGQACIQNRANEIVCAPVASNSSTPSNSGGNTPNSSGGGGNTSGSGGGLLEGLTTFGGAGSGLNTGGTLIGYIANIIRWILGILGTVFFVIIVLQGYLYMISSGDASKTAAATGAITNAVIGLLIIMGAFLITNFVTSGLIAAGA